MGNACGCAEDKADNLVPASIGQGHNNTPYTPYKIPNFQSKITPQIFASIESKEKDILLVEAFNLLVSTVEPSKIKTNNQLIKQLTIKTVGKARNQVGDEYEGEFINGLANGRGKITRKDGSIFKGEMFNGVPHGEGTAEYGQGNKYKMQYYKGLPFGLYTEQRTVPEKQNVEGGCDERGLETGPQYTITEKGDVTFKLFKDDQEHGLQVHIPKDRSVITVTERKGEQTTKIGTYTSRVTGQPTAAK